MLRNSRGKQLTVTLLSDTPEQDEEPPSGRTHKANPAYPRDRKTPVVVENLDSFEASLAETD